MHSVSHDGGAIANPQDFLQPMGDVNDGYTFPAQIVDQLKEYPHFSIGQRSGRLVHHEHLGVERQRFRDFDHLLLGDAECSNRLIDIDGQPDLRKNFDGRVFRFSMIDQRPAPPFGFPGRA